jgi:putative transposase
MKKSRFTDEQIIRFLKRVETGAAVKERGRKHGVTDASFRKWRSRFGGMDVADVRRLREREGENGKLKKLLAEAMPAKTGISKRRAWSLIGLSCTALHYEARSERDCGVLRSRILLLVG